MSVGAQEPARVGQIEIQRIDVFDTAHPDENRPPYTWVNKLHILTRESVVRREILLEPGDTFDPYLVENSERNLRAYPFIKSAQIEPWDRPDGTVGLMVRVQDTWTTDISPSIGFAAGEQKFGMLLRERNFLGRGKTLETNYNDGFGTVSRGFSYRDPRVWGSRLSARLYHSNSSQGYDTEVSLALPVYSLLTPYSTGVQGRHGTTVDPIYKSGEEVARIREEYRGYEAFVGHPLTATSRRAVRSTYGYAFVENVFGSSVTGSSFALPDDRRLSMIKWTVDYEESDYFSDNLINKFELIEDINLGWQAQARLAYASRDLGALRNEVLPRLTVRKGQRLGPRQFLLEGGGVYFIYGDSQWRHVVASAYGSYYRKSFLIPKNTLVIHGEIANGLRLQRDSQLMLGGNAGLRGYRFNAFTGTRSLLFNAESRFYAIEDWLHIVSIAPILFWDAGYVWSEGEQRKARDLKHNVGLGLRLGFTRSATVPVVRMDLSYAPNKEGTVGGGWVFSAGIHHTFDFADNALRRVSRD